jgi:hypothetical protein
MTVIIIIIVDIIIIIIIIIIIVVTIIIIIIIIIITLIVITLLCWQYEYFRTYFSGSVEAVERRLQLLEELGGLADGALMDEMVDVRAVKCR